MAETENVQKVMNPKPDSDGLPPSQIARIQRVQLTRYRKARRESIKAWLPIWLFLCGIWLVIGLAFYIVDQKVGAGNRADNESLG